MAVILVNMGKSLTTKNNSAPYGKGTDTETRTMIAGNKDYGSWLGKAKILL